MGTNFYWRSELVLLPTGDAAPVYRDDPVIHIGKRSAAGPYCWDCDITLCADGNDGVHTSRSPWHTRCPRCGREPTAREPLSDGPAAIELGFAQPNAARPTGVRGTSSFSWAQDPERVGALCEQRADEAIIEDEYGDTYTGRLFLDMLHSNCAIQFTEWIGSTFS